MTSDDVSLRDHIAQQWKDHQERHEDERREREAALAAQGRLVDAAFVSSQKAIEKAEESQKERDNKANEFRGQLDDQARSFFTRDAHDRFAADLDRRLSAMDTNIRDLQYANAREQGALAVARFVGFGGLLTGLAALIYAIVGGGVKP